MHCPQWIIKRSAHIHQRATLTTQATHCTTRSNHSVFNLSNESLPSLAHCLPGSLVGWLAAWVFYSFIHFSQLFTRVCVRLGTLRIRRISRRWILMKCHLIYRTWRKLFNCCPVSETHFVTFTKCRHKINMKMWKSKNRKRNAKSINIFHLPSSICVYF